MNVESLHKDSNETKIAEMNQNFKCLFNSINKSQSNNRRQSSYPHVICSKTVSALAVGIIVPCVYYIVFLCKCTYVVSLII